MATYQFPILDKNNKNNCSWTVPIHFRENTGLAELGRLQQYLSLSYITTCEINLANVEWADPTPLLSLGLLLAEFSKSKKVTIDLGSVEETSTPNHRIFLKFLAQQGFLTEFGRYTEFYLDKNLQEDVEPLRLKLSIERQDTHFANANCIFAKIIEMDDLHESHIWLQIKVEELIREAQDRAIDSAFGKHPFARDMLFQKLRKLLFELLLNISEHSQPLGNIAFAGVYARIRGAKPTDETPAKTWMNLFTQLPYGQAVFTPNPYSEWLEIYICDVGKGLLTDINNWQIPQDNEQVANAIEAAKRAKKPLESICVHLFRSALSKKTRDNKENTAVTGLQHLGHLLSIGNDYGSIYSQEGSWIGNYFPWSDDPNDYARKHIQDEKSFINFKPVSGTAYAFCIQPEHPSLESFNERWTKPDESSLNAIIATLKNQKASSLSNVVFYEGRGLAVTGSAPTYEEISKLLPSIVVFRPPRLISKKDFANWLNLFVEDPHFGKVWSLQSWILADLSPFQLLILSELLMGLRVYIGAKLEIYLVSEHWAVTCFTTSEGSFTFEENKVKAKNFLNQHTDEACFSASQLATLLREKDSEIFWGYALQKPFVSFFDNPVDWHDSSVKDKPIRLNRYLDFPHALAEPSHYRACRRALRRTIALFPGYSVKGADKLISTLANNTRMGTYTDNPAESIKRLIVGSVSVTAKTAHEVKKNDDVLIQMMVHGDAPTEPNADTLVAMLWITELNSRAAIEIDQKINDRDIIQPWQRIPNTSFIAPHGERSISLLRYRECENGHLDFNSTYYGRTPEQTYQDFQRLEILKTGHWQYGRRHDLLTVNALLAFYFSFLEKGPLYDWLILQFEELFVKPEDKDAALAQLLIYPSHSVTDTMVDRIKQDDGFIGKLPESGMFPVKLLGIHTVSPILVSPLVAWEIERQLTDKAQKKGLKRNDYQWSAVIFDDGAVSGKHLRELKTYLQGLGAEHVFTLVFLDRTGQPAQEKILKKFLWQNRRFWRWDVPALGNQRDCLLCQGLAIVETFSHDLHSPTQKERLTKWLAQWEVRDVETQWNDNPRLLQTPDMHGLTITFGVNKEKSWGEKTLTPNDSSSATAILMELTRLTTRADVVMKKVRWLEKKYRSEEQETLLDIAMEMIASQLLLYLDELSLQEQKQRLKTMLSLIWERPNANNATILGGLCFTFVDKKIIEELWSYCLTSLLKVKRLGNFDAILAVNILCSRHEFITKTKYLPSGNIGSIESDNYIMLARGTVQKKVRDVLSQYLIVLHRNISGYHENTHKSEIKIRLSSLIDADEADNLDTQIAEILTDLDKINKILDDLEAVSLDHFNKNDRDILSTLVFDLNRENKKIDEDKNITSISSKIMEFLYGSGTKNGFIDQLSKKLFIACAIDSFDRDFFRTIRLDVLNTNRWNEIVKAKNKKNELKGEMLCWVDKDGEKIIQPKVEYSDNNQKDSLWFYCDKYVTCVLDETLSNVYHTELDIPNAQTNNEYYQHKEINNPFIETPSEKTAHLWWHVKRENDHVVIETANACNKKAVLRPSVNRSRLENAGGKVELVIIKNIAYATVKIPLFSLFVEER